MSTTFTAEQVLALLQADVRRNQQEAPEDHRSSDISEREQAQLTKDRAADALLKMKTIELANAQQRIAELEQAQNPVTAEQP